MKAITFIVFVHFVYCLVHAVYYLSLTFIRVSFQHFEHFHHLVKTSETDADQEITTGESALTQDLQETVDREDLELDDNSESNDEL